MKNLMKNLVIVIFALFSLTSCEKDECITPNALAQTGTYYGVVGGTLYPTPEGNHKLIVEADAQNDSYSVTLVQLVGNVVKYTNTFSSQEVNDGTIVIEQKVDSASNNQKVVKYVDSQIEFLGGQ